MREDCTSVCSLLQPIHSFYIASCSYALCQIKRSTGAMFLLRDVKPRVLLWTTLSLYEGMATVDSFTNLANVLSRLQLTT
jgi:hypothetical protein